MSLFVAALNALLMSLMWKIQGVFVQELCKPHSYGFEERKIRGDGWQEVRAVRKEKGAPGRAPLKFRS
jgi:hypothetical protein